MKPSAVLLVLAVLALRVTASPAAARPHVAESGSGSGPGTGSQAVRHHGQHGGGAGASGSGNGIGSGHHAAHGHMRPRVRLCDRQHATPEQRRRCFCGRELAEAIREICRGRGYNEPDSATVHPARSGSSGGGATDCCYKGCSYAELEQFCRPRTNPASSVESEGMSDNSPLEEAHQENHIRPQDDSEPSNETTDRPPTLQMPSVLGGRSPPPKFNLTRLAADMVSVGTINTPRHVPVAMPVPKVRHHGSSANALSS